MKKTEDEKKNKKTEEKSREDSFPYIESLNIEEDLLATDMGEAFQTF